MTLKKTTPRAKGSRGKTAVRAKPATPRKRRTAADPVTAYARAVVAGKTVAGPHVRASCARHLRDLKDGAARGLRWDVPHALHYIAFFEGFLRLNGGEFEGKPFILEAWQKFIIGALFGWLRADTGARRFITAYIEIGKGNGKSPLAAGVGHAGLVLDREPRAEIYAAATKKDQAMILFRDAVAMADLSPELRGRLQKTGVGERTWNIAYPATHSFFRPISSDDGQSGPRPHIALIDEVHEHKDPIVLDMLRRGVKGRRQPMIFEITNSGVDRTSICFAHHEASIAAASALPGEKGFDDTWFSYVCALDDGDDWMNDPACWVKANPNVGVSIPRKYLEDAVREARNIPSRANLIARLNFCVWTDSVSAWISKEAWQKVWHPFDAPRLAGAQSYAGLDLGSRKDMTAAAFFIPDGEGGGDAFVEYWTPADTLREREDADRASYQLWVKEGHLNAVPGASVDYGHVMNRLVELCQEYPPIALAFDRYRIHDLRREIDAEGYDIPLVEHGQGFKDMSPAVDELEALILNGRIRLHYNPILNWNAASAVLEMDPAGNRKFTKRKCTGRIDGLVALTMAIGAWRGTHQSGRSVYEDRGLLEVEVMRV